MFLIVPQSITLRGNCKMYCKDTIFFRVNAKMYRYTFNTQTIHTNIQSITKIAIHDRYTIDTRIITGELMIYREANDTRV